MEGSYSVYSNLAQTFSSYHVSSIASERRPFWTLFGLFPRAVSLGKAEQGPASNQQCLVTPLPWENHQDRQAPRPLCCVLPSPPCPRGSAPGRGHTSLPGPSPPFSASRGTDLLGPDNSEGPQGQQSGGCSAGGRRCRCLRASRHGRDRGRGEGGPRMLALSRCPSNFPPHRDLRSTRLQLSRNHTAAQEKGSNINKQTPNNR